MKKVFLIITLTILTNSFSFFKKFNFKENKIIKYLIPGCFTFLASVKLFKIYKEKEIKKRKILENEYKEAYQKEGKAILGLYISSNNKERLTFYSLNNEKLNKENLKENYNQDLNFKKIIQDLNKVNNFEKDYKNKNFYFLIKIFSKYIKNFKKKNEIYNVEKTCFKENIFIDISCKEISLTLTTDFLNRQLSGYLESLEISKKFINNKNSVWAISQPVLIYTNEQYEKEEKKEILPREVIVISSFGCDDMDILEKDDLLKKFIKKMYESIFQEFLKRDSKKNRILSIATIGTGIFLNGRSDKLRDKIKNFYAEVFYEILIQKKEDLTKKKAFILLNNNGIKSFENKFKENNKEFEKILMLIPSKDVFNIPEKMENQDIDFYILNPSNKSNIKNIENLGNGSGGEGNIGNSTSIKLNKIFKMFN